MAATAAGGLGMSALVLSASPAAAFTVVTVERVSLAADGSEFTQVQYEPSQSGDGAHVSFTSRVADSAP